ncbi:MAG: response regulator [Chloroflexi bacterium]|nr:response regulator [Chloroflexota bacterium]
MKSDRACLLVVDSNEMNRDMLSRRLDRQGHNVVAVESGSTALSKLQTHQFDLILLDIMIPDMNSFELLKCLKATDQWQHIPVVIMALIGDMESVIKGLEFGAEDYLPKPFSPMLLQARIQATLERKRLNDQAQARLAEMAIMQRIGTELNATLDARRVMEITLEWAMRQAGGEAGAMGALVDGQIIVLAAQGYTYEVSAGNSILLPDSFPAMQSACHRRELIYEPDTSGVGLLARTRSQIALPIQRESKIVAMLLLESTTPHFWDEPVLAFLSRLSSHAAIAITNAQLYEVVQSANEAKTEFVSFVSHELKTPMTAIKGYADLLVSGNFGDLNQSQQSFLQILRSNVVRMTTLVSDLEDISRIESGGLRLNRKAVSMKELLEDVVQSIKSQIEAKDQTLDVDIVGNVPEVLGDRTRLTQILTNLVSNAHKYTPENGRIAISAQQIMEMNGHQQQKSMVHVAIADNGLGIRDEDQEEIFDKFFRGHDDEILKLPGTGLGLNITKNLVDLHNGRIWFESTYGEGTTFHVAIPAAA